MKSDPEEEKEPFFPSQGEPSDKSITLKRESLRSKFSTSLRGPTLPWSIVVLLLLGNIAIYITHSSSHEILWSSTDFGECLNHAISFLTRN
jgi:hypothetical protein